MSDATIFRSRRDTAADWAAKNPVLYDGQSGLETDTKKLKYGDGVTAWNDLPYLNVDASVITEAVQDIVGAMLLSGANITVTYDDGAGTATIAVTGVLPAARMPAFAGGDVTSAAGSAVLTLAAVNASPGSFGAADKTVTATVNAKGLVTALAAVAIAITASQVTDFSEATDDRVAALISAPGNVSAAYNDAGNSLVIDLIASPALAGAPTAATAANATSNTQLATTAFVHNVIADVINAAPAALDTLKELADAIGDDANYAATVTTNLATKMAKSANLSDLTNTATARDNLGVMIGRDVQAYHANLSAFAGLALVADRLPYANGVGTLALTTFTAAGRALIDDADAAAQRVTLGLGTSSTVDTGTSGTKVPLLDGVNSWSGAQTFLNSSGIKILDTDASHTVGIIIGSNISANRTFTLTLGDANRTLDISAGNVTISAAGAALIDDADAAAQRATLGLVIGTNVQAQDAELAAIAGLTSAADKLPYFTGSGAASLADFTSTARSLLDDTSVGAMRVTLGAAASGANTDITSITGLTGNIVTSAGLLLVGTTSGSFNIIRKSVAEGGVVAQIDGGNYGFIFYGVDTGGASGTATGLSIGKNTTTGRSINTAGTINASGADYAEYMTKAPGCGAIAKGDVCGVDASGRLVTRWAEANSFVVKSTDPAYVGGDKWAAHLVRPIEPPEPIAREGERPSKFRQRQETHARAMARHLAALAAHEAAVEEARVAVDRIAFAGQVPVNVSGRVAIGDYIVAAQHGEGIKAVAVPEAEIDFPTYRRRIGKVWAIRGRRAWIDVQHG